MKRVTVIVLTYNLEQYIGECLDSILGQKTNFDYGILIADDASTDNTQEILKEYKEKYPEKIELILSNKNGGTLTNNNRALEKVKTEYFTLIDGDDYWIYDRRLQEQVDFLDANSEFTMCSGNTIYLRGEKRAEKVIPTKYLNREYTFEDLCHFRMPYVHTSAMLTRNIIYSKQVPREYYDVIGTYEECAIRGDYIRILQHLQRGKLKVMDMDYSVYRVRDIGVWQGQNNLSNVLESAISFQYFRKHIDDRKTGFFEQCVVETYREMMECLVKDKEIHQKYTLSAKEHRLYRELMNDLYENPPKWEEYPYKKKKKLLIGLKQMIRRLFHR